MAGTFILTLRLLCTVFACLLLLRAYLRYLRAPANDPISSFAETTTRWAVSTAAKFIPHSPRIDWPSLFVCYLVAVIYQFFHWLMGSGSGGFFPFFIGSAVLVVYWAVELAMFAALLFCITSWVNQASTLYRTMSFLCYPFLTPIKRFIPVWKNIDFSAIVFFIIANIILSLLAPFT